MDEAMFWSIVDRARESGSPEAPSADAERLHEILSPLSDDQVRDFGTEFVRQMIRLNDWSVWAAGYAANGGLSDDGFEYFRRWLVGKGSLVVERMLSDADNLTDWIGDEEIEEGLENEELGYVASEILESRGLDPFPWQDLEGYGASPRRTPFKEETVEEDFPRLSARQG